MDSQQSSCSWVQSGHKDRTARNGVDERGRPFAFYVQRVFGDLKGHESSGGINISAVSAGRSAISPQLTNIPQGFYCLTRSCALQVIQISAGTCTHRADSDVWRSRTRPLTSGTRPHSPHNVQIQLLRLAILFTKHRNRLAVPCRLERQQLIFFICLQKRRE